MRNRLVLIVLGALILTLCGVGAVYCEYYIVWTGESWPLAPVPGYGEALAIEQYGGETYIWHPAQYGCYLVRLRLSDSTRVTCIPPLCSPGTELAGLEFVDGHIWHVPDHCRVYKLDPDSCAKVDEIGAGWSPRGLAWDGSSLWTLDLEYNLWYALDGSWREYPVPFSDPRAIAWDGSHIWIGSAYDNHIHMFDPLTGAEVDSAFIGDLGGVMSMQIVPSPECPWDIYMVPGGHPFRIERGLLIEGGASRNEPGTWGKIKSEFGKQP